MTIRATLILLVLAPVLAAGQVVEVTLSAPDDTRTDFGRISEEPGIAPESSATNPNGKADPEGAVITGGPLVTLEVIDDMAAEAGQDVMVFRFSRTGGNVNQILDVNVTIEPTSTASLTGGGVDLTGDDGGTLAAFQRVQIQAGVTSRDITFTPVLDNRVEPTERLDLSLAPGSYNIGTPNSGGATLADDPPIAMLEVIDDMAAEAGQDVMAFRFSRTGGNVNQILDVNVTIEPTSTASLTGGGVDLTGDDGGTLAAFQRVQIQAGVTSRDITFTPVLDNRVEPTERLDLSLAPGSYNIGTPNSGGATLADDPPIAMLEVIDDMAAEAGQDVMVFRFSRTGGNVNQILDVNVTIEPTSTASLTGGGVDLTGDDGGTLAAFQRVQIQAGVTSRDITFTPVLDNRVEPTERLDLSLAPGSYNIGTPNSGGATLADDPPIAMLEVIDDMAAEAGQDVMVFRFSRTGGNVNQILDVNVTIEPTSTASLTGGGVDLTGDDGGTLAAFQRVQIQAGVTSRDITFTPVLDNRVEPTERLDLSLAPGSYNIGTPNSGGATLADDPPVVSITVVQPEAAEGGAAGVLAISRAGGNVNQALTANASIGAASTVDDSDFTVDDGGALQAFGTVNIPAGQTARELAFAAIEDGLVEDEELLILELQAGSYVLGSPASGTLIFIDGALFADGFESPVAGLDACSLNEHTDLSPIAFDVDGGQVYDFLRGLIWLRCAPTQRFDWFVGRCSGPASAFERDRAAILAEFNAGRLGDNDGVSTWRFATPPEKAEAGFDGTCFVR